MSLQFQDDVRFVRAPSELASRLAAAKRERYAKWAALAAQRESERAAALKPWHKPYIAGPYPSSHPPTIEEQFRAAHELIDRVVYGRGPEIAVRTIKMAVASEFRVSIVDIDSPRRMKIVCLARQVAMYLSRELTRNSLPEIGRLFGGKDHTTILHGCRKISAMILENAAFADKVEKIKTSLAGDVLKLNTETSA